MSRPRLMAMTVIASLALVIPATIEAQSPAGSPDTRSVQSTDWPMLRGDSGRSGSGSGGPQGDPVLRWRYQAQGAANQPVVASADLAYTSTDDGILHALSLADGTERWSWTPQHIPPTDAALDGDTLYAFDGLGTLYALDAATGTERWHAAESLGAPSQPAIGDGLLYVASDDAAVHALSLTDGSERWSYAIPGGASLHNVAAADGIVAVAGDSGGFNALDAATGALRWHHDLGTDPSGTAVVAEGVAFVGASGDGGGHLDALDAATGDLLWTDAEALFSPAVADGIAISPGSIGEVVAHDARTGSELWRTAVTGSTRPLAIADGVAYIGADDQHAVVALDIHTGEQLWSFGVDDNIDCCTAVAHGVVLLGTGYGSVYAIGGTADPAPTSMAGATRAAASAAPAPMPSGAAEPNPSPAPSPVTAGIPDRNPTAAATTDGAMASSSAALAQSPWPPRSLSDPFTVVATLDQATTGLVEPFSLDVGPDGNLYVADLEPSIRVISPTGQPVRRWGEPGTRAGQLNFGDSRAAIAVGADGLVYVLEGGNHRIQVFQPDGTFVRQFGSFGNGPGQFLDPMDVAVDGSGDVVVIDDAAETVSMFDASGPVLWTIGGSGETDPDLIGHHHRGEFDSQGRYWLTNDDNSRAVAIDHEGHKVDAFGAAGTGSGQFEGTTSMAFDASDNAYVDECSDKRLQVLDPAHQVIGALTAPGGLPFGDSYAFGPDGLLYAIVGGNHCAGSAPRGSATADILVMRATLP
jgi:outer membrane protein assembly factor BamB